MQRTLISRVSLHRSSMLSTTMGAGPGGGGAGAGAGAGGGGGAAFGGGGGGGGSHGALATTPPALETMYPSLHSASAVAPPALASLALASATTAGSSWARAGQAASMATASIAASIINFLNLPTYLLVLLEGESSLPLGGEPSCTKGPPPTKSY